MSNLYVLVEHGTGYGVFKVQEFEEIGMLLPQLQAGINDLSRLNSVVKLEAFSPFKSAHAALENQNAISEGIVTEDLQYFLDITFPKGGKKSDITLGVEDPKLGAAIKEALGITCTHTGIVPEVIRGIRCSFHKFVKEFTPKTEDIAHLGLAHSYARAKMKFNVHREDNMIIQSIALADQLVKDINTFSMRMQEWYSYHFPELVKIVPDNYTYARLAKFIQNRKELSEDSLEGLEEITMDSAKAQAILDAARSSMGMDINIIDLTNIVMFADRVIGISEYKNQIMEYLKTKMSNVAPNLASLIGEQVGARLIAHAGSLTKLAKHPASTVQILGAEKALFRALKTKGNTPKYGLLFHSTFVGRAGTRNKGRISRYLANKCSIASRIDCFTEQPSRVFGEKLRQQVEDRLKFYETGDIPKKNIEVMKEALEEYEHEQAQIKSEQKKKKKKRKSEVTEQNGSQISIEEPITPKKKKKKSMDTAESTPVEDGVVAKKQKKSLIIEENVTGDFNKNVSNNDAGQISPKKKKKKSKRAHEDE